MKPLVLLFLLMAMCGCSKPKPVQREIASDCVQWNLYYTGGEFSWLCNMQTEGEVKRGGCIPGFHLDLVVERRTEGVPIQNMTPACVADVQR
jgi:membrane-associated PAP2 superfamily phosphatase